MPGVLFYSKPPMLLFSVAANESTFSVGITFRQTEFREITQTKAYDINTLVGNMGGYMGLLLGYAVLNFPDLVRGFVGLVKERLLGIH